MSYYKKVHSKKYLLEAWKKVHENGLKSQSRDDFIKYNSNAETRVRTLSDQLREKRFKFYPAEGIPLRRKGKTPRPIVKYPIPNSIVQRRLLDILQAEPLMTEYYKNETSFGGIESRGVKDAIKMAHNAVKGGCQYYICSDIAEFFRNIPKKEVIKTVVNVIKDDDFIALLEAAIAVELSNLDKLGRYVNLFPRYELGVAQGCCLSPLMGNILLYEFDRRMNGRGIICLRYIDDFIILGKSESNVKRAFISAQKYLSEYGLNAYDPLADTDKASIGMTEKGFDFLGCSIRPNIIVPAKKSRKRILSKLDEIFEEGISYLKGGGSPREKRGTLIKILDNVSNTLRGWGNQYSFCNDRRVFLQMDKVIDDKLSKFFRRYNGIRSKFESDASAKRRLLGVHLLEDSKEEPII